MKKTKVRSRKSSRKPRRSSSSNRVKQVSKPSHESKSPIGNILVPIDFSDHSKKALRYAWPLASRFDASLRLIYVVEPTIYPADLGFGQVVLPEVEDGLYQRGVKELKSLVEEEIGGKAKASSVVRTGKPHQEILFEAEECGADLIIVASHGHTGVEQILFGSTAMRLVRLAKCPVLTIRPQN
jgi:nucleotide-binding universal stress UspA family protein